MNNTFVFIAGPYAAKDGGHGWDYYYEIDRHINEARRWATKLTEHQIPFFCPHMNSAHMEVLVPSAGKDFWYNLDNLFLDQASSILLIPDWEESKGALAEAKRAEELCLPTYWYNEFDELVADWQANMSTRKD